MDGVPTLTDDILAARGFALSSANVDDVMVCYNDIILAHQKIMELWYNGYAHTSGPQIDRIIQKSLSVFPRLESTKVADAVEFYDRLQEVGLSQVMRAYVEELDITVAGLDEQMEWDAWADEDADISAVE
jgi:hypothetical protein